MSQNTLELLLFALLLGLAVLIWCGVYVRRQIRAYSDKLRQVKSGTLPAAELPLQSRGLEPLASVIHDLAEENDQRVASLQAEKGRLAAVLDQMTDGVLIAFAERGKTPQPGEIFVAS